MNVNGKRHWCSVVHLVLVWPRPTVKEKGAEVVVISRDPSKAGQLENIRTVACDVRDTDALSKVFESEALFDILISAATGGSRASGPFCKWI